MEQEQRAFWAWLIAAGGWTCRGYIRGHEGRQGLSSAFFLQCLKAVPELESFNLHASQGCRLSSFQLTI